MKTKFTFIILLSIFGLSSALAQIPTNGLVGYWPFNGNANDESGNGYNGTVNGATLTTDRFGNSNSAYSFDGISNYIASTPTAFPISSSPRTVSAWFNTTVSTISGNDPADIQTITAYGSADGGHVIFPQFIRTGKAHFQSGSYANSLYSIDSVVNGNWHNIVTTYGGAGAKVKMYIDGVVQDSTSNITLNTVSSFFGIGLSPWRNIYFQGKLDDIGIWNRALDNNEIISLYNESPCSQTMCVSADTLDFGNMFIGYPESRQMTVFNNGHLDLLISNVTIDLVDYTVTPSFAGIDPGEYEVFTVTFAPQVVASYPATLTFHSNDSLNPSYPIALLGSGLIPPVIAATPDSIVDTVYSGKTSSHTISINNTGGSNLEYAMDFNSWINAIPASGSCIPGATQYSTAILNASNMGEGDYSGSLSILSNDPGNLQVEIPVKLHVIDAPSILAGTDTLDFGNVFAGYPDTLYLEVTNNGSQDLLISGISAVPAQYSIYPLYMSIDPGETEQVQVVFSSLTVGYYPGFMTLTSNDPVFAQQQIILLAQAIEPPVIAVNPDSLSAELHPNQTISIPFTIINNGGSDLNFIITPGEGSQNYALDFDGTDDYINIGDNINLANSSITLEAWVKKISGSGSGDHHMIWGQGTTSTNFGLVVGFRDYFDDFIFAFFGNDLTTPITNLDSSWHHWACTFDASTKIRKIYTDGIEVASDIASANYQGTGTLYIGVFTWYNAYFQGNIDEVRIWNVARTQEEIQRNMVYPLFGNEQGLLGYWNFDEGTGLNVFDKSPNGYNGILMNGVSWTDESAPLGPSWLTVSQDSGTISAHSSLTVNAVLNATSLALGEYNASIKIYSNDPAKHVVDIPVQLLLTSLVGEDELVAKGGELFCYPNPFTGSTTVMYSLKETEQVTLQIFDNFGRQVAKPVNEFQPQGEQKIEWNAGNLPAGIYYCRLQAGERIVSNKIIKMK